MRPIPLFSHTDQCFTAGAMLLQVPERALLTATAALGNDDFRAAKLQSGPDLSHEQVRFI